MGHSPGFQRMAVGLIDLDDLDYMKVKKVSCRAEQCSIEIVGASNLLKPKPYRSYAGGILITDLPFPRL
jgi:hypothetical protein